MKKILSVCLMIAFALALCFVPMMSACGHPAIESMIIDNYSNYTAIGVGTLPSGANASSTIRPVSSRKEKPALIGKRKDGKYEKISFKGEDNLTHTYGVSAIRAIGPFTFINYAKNYTGEVSRDINNSIRDFTFMLDQKSGKMFNITEYDVNVITYGCFGASDDAFFSHFYYNGHESIYKFSVVNGELEMKEVVNCEHVTVFGGEFLVDRYGNLFVRGKSDQTEYVDHVDSYMITTAGKLKNITDLGYGDIKIAMNGIVYTGPIEGYSPTTGQICNWNYDYWINENGEVEEATFVPEDFTNLLYDSMFHCNVGDLNNAAVLIEGNTTYYYSTAYDRAKIIKYNAIDDIEYEIETIYLKKYEETNGVVLKDRIYFLNNSEVYYVNIRDGEYTSLASDYLFNKIYSSNGEGVTFEGVDENLDIVIGTINYDGTTSIGVVEKDYEVLYIQAIN